MQGLTGNTETFDNIQTDYISERATSHGVDIDGVLCKDATIVADSTLFRKLSVNTANTSTGYTLQFTLPEESWAIVESMCVGHWSGKFSYGTVFCGIRDASGGAYFESAVVNGSSSCSYSAPTLTVKQPKADASWTTYHFIVRCSSNCSGFSLVSY